MLTPLVDVMFLLLLFFMFTAPTTPFGLLHIAGSGASQAAAGPAPGPARQFLVTATPGGVRVNGQQLDMAKLAQFVQESMTQGYVTALVNASAAATAQDLVNVLDALRRANVPHVVVIETGTEQ